MLQLIAGACTRGLLRRYLDVSTDVVKTLTAHLKRRRQVRKLDNSKLREA